MKRHWLFKSEPNSYSWDDLVQDKVAEWDGVRTLTGEERYAFGDGHIEGVETRK